MALKTSLELHHNFPKLAEETGFTFNTHKPRGRIEWNKFRVIDIETLIRDRKFRLIEQNLNDILDCVIESEFDVRILDEGVLKMFRLAQLTIEYQQFCRQYLDRSVYILREEITTLAKELDYAKKEIRDKDEEIKKHKRKVKYNYRGQPPYGNDNIASMILQTLANKSDLFPSNQNHHTYYNKCTYCDKVFMNQLYLKSHLTRRHSNIAEIPQKDATSLEQRETNIVEQDNHSKLQKEIMELKSKLKDMEIFVKLVGNKTHSEGNLETPVNDRNDVAGNETTPKTNNNNTNQGVDIQTKDAQVSTYSENYILEKLEKWKKEESEKYNKEICLLRTQINEIIESHKEIKAPKSETNDTKIMEQLQETIKQQSAEIASLKQELINSRLKSSEETNIKKEIEAQIAYWAERVEVQSKEYNRLLQKLDDVAKDAQESRKQANLEKERAAKLQELLEQKLNDDNNSKNCSLLNRVESTENVQIMDGDRMKSPKKSHTLPDRKTLEKLQRKAQQLLNQSISSSETSSSGDKIDFPLPIENTDTYKENKKKKSDTANKKSQKNGDIKIVTNGFIKNKTNHNHLTKKAESRTSKTLSRKVSDSVQNHGSPLKIIRAKVTEEVNQRLVSLGVDPLKKRLPRDVFQKHRIQLQENNEIKSKRNASREKVYHCIISHLDDKATINKKQTMPEADYISPSKSVKPFSLTSVISNVKSKALSLVKTNDSRREDKTKHDAVTKKALTLLKTPPGSATSSPLKNQRPNRDISQRTELSQLKVGNNRRETSKTQKTMQISDTSDSSDTDTSESFKLNNTETVADVNHKTQLLSAGSSRSEIKAETKIKDNETPSRKPKNIINAFKTVNLDQKLVNNDDVIPLQEHELRYAISDENINSQKQTKGVLKNATSMSSLYKKKVLFDMDAIQMKSVSASPSQSVTEKSDKDEKYELGIINLDTEEWDISSIENEPINNQKEIKLNSRTSPKIAELKESIEAQLNRRNQSLSTALIGGVDVLKGPTLAKAASLGGSNTSLGSSILDESDCVSRNNSNAFVKPKNITENDDSEIDISELFAVSNTKA